MAIFTPHGWDGLRNHGQTDWCIFDSFFVLSGLIRGEYEAKKGVFLPGGASLHLCMSPHGPDMQTFEVATAKGSDDPHHIGRDTMAFMFETHLFPKLSAAAAAAPNIDRDYYKCWVGLKQHCDVDALLKLADGAAGAGGAGGGAGGGGGGATKGNGWY